MTEPIIIVGLATLILQIRHLKDAYELLKQTWDKNKIDLLEQLKIILLNRNNKILGIYELSQGGITGTVADPRLTVVAALKANAVSLCSHIIILQEV